MITRILGYLNKILEDRIRLQVGAIEYELLVPEAARQSLENKIGQEVTLHTRHYLEAGAMQSTIYPRLIGFETETDLEFFDLLCTVDKVGVRKALKAFSLPVQEMASVIQRGDVKSLSKLPGIGATTAEKMISTLQKKVLPYCLEAGTEAGSGTGVDPILHELINRLMKVGMNPYETRNRVDVLIASGQKFTSIEDAMAAAFRAAG
ncbi:MAG TPA: helix-hairpin-helix domain-containing protein [Gemmatales bacterium]|nr:helix-hairpin-helix domain-containing protein [Gemmatales bacterium]